MKPALPLSLLTTTGLLAGLLASSEPPRADGVAEVAEVAGAVMRAGVQPSPETHVTLAEWRRLRFGGPSPAEYRALMESWNQALAPSALAQLLAPGTAVDRSGLHRFVLAGLEESLGGGTLQDALTLAYREHGGELWANRTATRQWLSSATAEDGLWAVTTLAERARDETLPRSSRALAVRSLAETALLLAERFPRQRPEFCAAALEGCDGELERLRIRALAAPAEDRVADMLVAAIHACRLPPRSVDALSDEQIFRLIGEVEPRPIDEIDRVERNLWSASCAVLLERHAPRHEAVESDLDWMAEGARIRSARALLIRWADPDSWWRDVGHLRPGTIGPLLADHLEPAEALRRWLDWHEGCGLPIEKRAKEASEFLFAVSEAWTLGRRLHPGFQDEVLWAGELRPQFAPVLELTAAELSTEHDAVARTVLDCAQGLARIGCGEEDVGLDVPVKDLQALGQAAVEKFALTLNFVMVWLLSEPNMISYAYEWFDRIPGQTVPIGYEAMSDAFLRAASRYGTVGRHILWRRMTDLTLWTDEEVAADAAELVMTWATPEDGTQVAALARDCRHSVVRQQLFHGLRDFTRRHPAHLESMSGLLQVGLTGRDWQRCLREVEYLPAVLRDEVFLEEAEARSTVADLLASLDLETAPAESRQAVTRFVDRLISSS